MEAAVQAKATETAVAYEQQLQEQQQQQEELKRAALIAQFIQDPSSLVKINIRRARVGKGNSPHILFITVTNNLAYRIGIYGKTGPGNDDSQSLLEYSVGPSETTEIVVRNHYYDNLPQLCLTLIMFDHESKVGSATMCQDIPLAVGAMVVANTGGSGLNVRSGAGTGHARVKTLPDGTALEIIGGPQEADGHTWYQVRDDVGTTTGWVIVGYIRLQ